jgi:rod shape-determining protein MreC
VCGQRAFVVERTRNPSLPRLDTLKAPLMRVSTPNNKRRRTPRMTASSGGPVSPEASFVGRADRRTRRGSRSRTRGSLLPKRTPSVLVRRLALSALLLLSMALITVSYRGGPVLHGAQLVVLEAVSPIERGMSRAWEPIAGAWDWTGRLLRATGENPKLERENADLRAKLRIAQVNQAYYEQQLEAFAFDQRGTFPNGYERVWASVAVRQPGTVESTLVIDRGSRHGIREDDAVLVVRGLAGKVIAVTPRTATVKLITDDAHRISASVVGSTAWGVLRTVSTQGTPTMQLGYVKQSAQVAVGDVVVTSGFASKNGELRSVYPRGIPVGTVTSVGNDPADLHKTVQVTPLADFGRIDEVVVLVARDRGAAE